jgi:sugar lactone lactonase YvrE
MIHDDTNCLLGEGPLWHPERGELFWFDILAHKLHIKGRHWTFDTYASAAGWVDHDTLLVATARDFRLLTLSTGAEQHVAPFEADVPANRSNDGRIDPWGGFWIGTMGIHEQTPTGVIYRFHKGELRTLYPGIAIPNAICFAPDGGTAYFTDTATQQIMRQRLDNHGWPKGDAELHVDLRGTGLWPDGAVVDAAGNLWNAQWGASRVAVYDPQGHEIAAHSFPALQTTCPAFGDEDLSTLFVTSAAVGLSQTLIAAQHTSGQTFVLPTGTKGQKEHRAIL